MTYLGRLTGLRVSTTIPKHALLVTAEISSEVRIRSCAFLTTSSPVHAYPINMLLSSTIPSSPSALTSWQLLPVACRSAVSGIVFRRHFPACRSWTSAFCVSCDSTGSSGSVVLDHNKVQQESTTGSESALFPTRQLICISCSCILLSNTKSLRSQPLKPSLGSDQPNPQTPPGGLKTLTIENISEICTQ